MSTTIHNLITPDPSECPDISAPQPVKDLSACERYSTPPALALWGPPNPLCPKCRQAHDPILDCPNPIAVAVPSEPEHDPCAELRAERDLYRHHLTLLLDGLDRQYDPPNPEMFPPHTTEYVLDNERLAARAALKG